MSWLKKQRGYYRGTTTRLVAAVMIIGGAGTVVYHVQKPPPPVGGGGTVNAASCSTADVQAAVNVAVDGDTVAIPNGSCSWTGGISTTKQITIRAQNYTPTPMGASTRNVTITHNAGTTPLLTLVTGNSFHVAVAGIHFDEGSGTGNQLRVSGSGSKIALISDNIFEVKQRNGNAEEITGINWSAQGGVFWNNRWVGLGPGPGGQANPDGSSFLIKGQPRVWNTASTMGTLDTGGLINLYIEDSTCFNVGQFPDADDHGRVVFRNNDLDGCSGLTHGFTSIWGGRHMEYYDNIFHASGSNVNLAGRYVWLRAGTAVFTGNDVAQENRGYGLPNQVEFIVEGGGTYPKPRQVGFGHNGTTDVSDPVYIWSQTGAGASSVGNGTPSLIQLDRDYFVGTAKPGWSRFTYPHPLRTS